MLFLSASFSSSCSWLPWFHVRLSLLLRYKDLQVVRSRATGPRTLLTSRIFVFSWASCITIVSQRKRMYFESNQNLSSFVRVFFSLPMLCSLVRVRSSLTSLEQVRRILSHSRRGKCFDRTFVALRLAEEDLWRISRREGWGKLFVGPKESYWMWKK